MVVSRHTTLHAAATAQALQTLAAATRSRRGRWRKMSTSTSSGSCSPGSAMALRGVGALPLPEVLVWRERGVSGFQKAKMLTGPPGPICGKACGPELATKFAEPSAK